MKTTTGNVLSVVAIYQVIAARCRYRGWRWALFVFLVIAGVFAYYAVSRLFVVWPYRVWRRLANP